MTIEPPVPEAPRPDTPVVRLERHSDDLRVSAVLYADGFLSIAMRSACGAFVSFTMEQASQDFLRDFLNEAWHGDQS